MAGSLTNAAETALLTLVFTNVAWANIGDASGLQPAGADGSFWVALFTVAPSDSAAGTECDYTDYARVEVGRTAGWTVAGNNVSNAAAVTFPVAGVTTADVAVAFGIMTAAVAGDLLFWGDITDPGAGLTISTGVTPSFAIGALDVNID